MNVEERAVTIVSIVVLFLATVVGCTFIGAHLERQEHRCIPTVCPALSDYTLTLPVYTDRDRWLNDLDACLDEMGRE